MGDYNDTFMRNQQNAAVQGRTKVQNRANVQQLKLIGQSHPTGLTTNLLKLFEPRPPLEFKPPPEKRKCPPLSGMAQFVSRFAEPGDAEYSPPVKEAETPVQRRARVHMLRLEKGAEKATEELQKYNPNEDQNISGDPYKTLFVARLSYETTESRIKREFESYGPIKRAVKNIAADEEISCLSATLAGGDASRDGKLYDLKVRVIADKESNKPRGYAFIEYVHTRDMKAAYKQADGRKIDGRRVLVDVERGRTVPNWRPRRLGGGLGTTRVGGEDVNQRYSGRDQLQSGGPPPPSEEPRAREDRHADRDREKSRERGREREKEREKSGEHSHDRHRDREHREDRHHRDRDRDRDRERERDRGRDRARDRDRDRGRDRGRDHDRHRERDRERERGRDKESERDIDVEDHDHEQGRSRDRESNYDRVESKHERDLHGEKERDYDHTEPEDDRVWYEQTEHGHKHPDQDLDPEQYEHHRSRGQYDRMDIQDDHDRYDQYPDRSRQYDRMDEDDYHYERATSESRERERTRDLEREYRRSDRSLSREDKH